MFEIYSIPKSVLIDPKGNIAAAGWDLRGGNFLKTLEKYLGIYDDKRATHLRVVFL